jgi:hypothetical protein
MPPATVLANEPGLDAVDRIEVKNTFPPYVASLRIEFEVVEIYAIFTAAFMSRSGRLPPASFKDSNAAFIRTAARSFDVGFFSLSVIPSPPIKTASACVWIFGAETGWLDDLAADLALATASIRSVRRSVPPGCGWLMQPFRFLHPHRQAEHSPMASDT